MFVPKQANHSCNVSRFSRDHQPEFITSDLQKLFLLMAPICTDVRCVLPSTVSEFPLHFSETIELSVLKVLELARDQLYREADCSACAQRAQVVIDYSWEKLNTGTWRDVDKEWRRVYSYGCLFKALSLCHENPSQCNVQEAIKTCDMGLLMGAGIMDNILQRLVGVLRNKVKMKSPKKAERSEEPCSKVKSSHKGKSKKLLSFSVIIVLMKCKFYCVYLSLSISLSLIYIYREREINTIKLTFH